MAWEIFKNNRNDSLKYKVEKTIKELPWDIDNKKIIEILKPTIGIRTKIASNKELKKGTSKFGGLPDLPKNIQWPVVDNKPMAFIAQINLSEINEFDKNLQLPKKGILYFFFYVEDENHHYPEKKEEYNVFFFDGNIDELETKTYPSNIIDLAKFKQCALSFFEHYSLPSYQNYQINKLNLSNNDENLLWDALEEISILTSASGDIGHQILGESQAQQGDVNFHWAFSDLNFKSYDLSDNQKQKIKEKEEKYILLFQVDLMDNNPGFSDFGGTGTAYFGITYDDLKNKRFNKVILVFQTT